MHVAQPSRPEASQAAVRSEALRYMSVSAPRSPEAHLVNSGTGRHLFIANGSRLFDIDAELFSRLDAAMIDGPIGELLAEIGLRIPPLIDDAPLRSTPVHALSLAVAQKCNLGCTYCYADQGGFGGTAKNMPQDIADRAVDKLIGDAAPDARLNLAFLGGEPLINRPVLQATTRRAMRLARAKRIAITFSITTNGTLLTPEDGEFFEEFGFAITVSLDGPRAVHDALRPYKGGRGSFDRIMENVAPLLKRQQRMQVSARVTVTPQNIILRETLDSLIAAGFHSVGFSPLLRAPNGNGEMEAGDLEFMLGQMIACGKEFERRSFIGERYPFANMMNAMREIARGTHRPYPCGAGAGYLGVSADGELSACHRFVGDPEGAMGSLAEGIDHHRQAEWLSQRHVHRQEPCRSCWARYLCGGGCHHEVIQRGRHACDYIRGWLHYCLEAYLRLTSRRAGEAAASTSATP